MRFYPALILILLLLASCAGPAGSPAQTSTPGTTTSPEPSHTAVPTQAGQDTPQVEPTLTVAPAQAATLEAKRLDDQEAPQREAARLASEEVAAKTKLEKARLVNKPKFRP